MLNFCTSDRGPVESMQDDSSEKIERDRIAHLITIGKAVEESPYYDYDNIQDVFNGKKTLDELSFLEDIIWTGLVLEKMNHPSKKGEEFFAERRRLGLGVGLDENGVLVSQRELNEEQTSSMDLN